MAYIPEQDVKKLWDQMGANKDWEALKDAVQNNREIGKRIDKDMSDKLIMIAERMKNYQFPDSPEELSDVLRQRMASWTDDNHPYT